ncbi:alpha/beta-hydrolase [Fistulina hepatica ATCC 64428]|uniref:Palmitoyl-protein thioesterase 1 n=1 Tax=Fistulina hepatica ATCC 64428 TaxID=1128425 RepID=A0A0D7A8C6_9AGAR|nr:alpha/beta-hydrolase [Fistulina hepatica ATCC 64428]
MLISLTVLFSLLALVFCLPAGSSPRPLVLWHGLAGDSYASSGMLEFASMIEDMHPSIFVHSVYLDEDLDKDQRAGFYGNVDEQIAFAAVQLAAIPELQDGFDAIGFSQGGQFLRAYVERYNSPPVRNLITFGAQHFGISDIPACRSYDVLCQIARRTAKASVYSEWAQHNLVQAQYYRDPTHYEQYCAANYFLTSINNEIPESRNDTYKENFASLENLVLVLFTEDETVIPKESSWFEDKQTSLSATAIEKKIVHMHEQPLYIEDWIGLRSLDEGGKVNLTTCTGKHMHIADCWEDIVREFVGAPL